mmetsp:Transcript_10664/g.37551  ORF Transcript_10664/g.37551 Transcript_10664/m.37551 type:complete len:274 (-) Transcript_10664:182-1003(-)
MRRMRGRTRLAKTSCTASPSSTSTFVSSASPAASTSVSAAASAPSSSSLGSSTRSASATSWEMGAVRVRATSLDSDSDGADDAAARLREVDDLREKLHAARRAREREATSRAGLAADAAALRSDLEDLQQRVARTARARVLAEQRASELSDQKRILVREVRQVRKVVADATAVSLPVADATAVASLPGDPGDHVGASGAAPLDGARAEPPALVRTCRLRETPRRHFNSAIGRVGRRLDARAAAAEHPVPALRRHQRRRRSRGPARLDLHVRRP